MSWNLRPPLVCMLTLLAVLWIPVSAFASLISGTTGIVDISSGDWVGNNFRFTLDGASLRSGSTPLSDMLPTSPVHICEDLDYRNTSAQAGWLDIPPSPDYWTPPIMSLYVAPANSAYSSQYSVQDSSGHTLQIQTSLNAHTSPYTPSTTNNGLRYGYDKLDGNFLGFCMGFDGPVHIQVTVISPPADWDGTILDAISLLDANSGPAPVHVWTLTGTAPPRVETCQLSSPQAQVDFGSLTSSDFTADSPSLEQTTSVVISCDLARDVAINLSVPGASGEPDPLIFPFFGSPGLGVRFAWTDPQTGKMNKWSSTLSTILPGSSAGHMPVQLTLGLVNSTPSASLPAGTFEGVVLILMSYN